jgi:hypothetical protein
MEGAVTPLGSLWCGCAATTTLSYISLLCAALACRRRGFSAPALHASYRLSKSRRSSILIDRRSDSSVA